MYVSTLLILFGNVFSVTSLIIGKTYIDTLNSFHSSDWTISKPSGSFFPFIPTNLATGILKQRYITCIKCNDDICIQDCENFRNYLNMEKSIPKMPKSQQALFGDDIMIGLTIYNQNDTNHVTIQGVLPLYTIPIMYNISAIVDYVKKYHEPCELIIDIPNTRWRNIFRLYDAFRRFD